MYAPNYIENKLKFFAHIKEAVVFGDRREMVCAVINIDVGAVGNWAERRGLAYSGYTDLAGKPEVCGLVQECIEKVNSERVGEGPLADSQIHRFLILHKELDPDDDELTRTRKVHRNFVALDLQNVSLASGGVKALTGISRTFQNIAPFKGMSVIDNLMAGRNLMIRAYARRDGKAAIAQTLEKVYSYFPRLQTRRSSQAAYTSGGEKQMCAIGRALMASPRMVLLDEPSMGLAPQIVDEVFAIVRDLNQKEGATFLLAEQNTNMTLRYADFGYILENGRVVMEGAARDLAANEDVKEFYLGLASGGRKSFRDVKHYRRRKHWLS